MPVRPANVTPCSRAASRLPRSALRIPVSRGAFVSSATALARPMVLGDLWASSRVRSIVLVIGAAALTALCAQISFPVPGSPVPSTGQTFAVLLAGAALGPGRGAWSQVLYVGVGALGLPVYSDAAGGVHVL